MSFVTILMFYIKSVRGSATDLRVKAIRFYVWGKGDKWYMLKRMKSNDKKSKICQKTSLGEEF